MNTNGKPLSSETSNFLLRKAREMVRNRKKRLKIKTDFCRGEIHTEHKVAPLGPISGMQFTAEVFVESGETVITFIVRHLDLDVDDINWTKDLNDLELERVVEQVLEEDDRKARTHRGSRSRH